MKLSSFWSTWARKAKKTPHFTLCPGYQNTQGSSSRGSCTLGTKPHLQSRTVGYSDHFIQSQDIITAGLAKEQHNKNTNRAMMSSKLLQLLILCRYPVTHSTEFDLQTHTSLANTHNSTPSSGYTAGLGMPRELRPTHSSLAGHSYERKGQSLLNHILKGTLSSGSSK